MIKINKQICSDGKGHPPPLVRHCDVHYTVIVIIWQHVFQTV